MHRKRHGRRDKKADDTGGMKSVYNGVLIARIKRMNSLPPHEMDWQSQKIVWRTLGGRKSSI